jgi:hypothetical protein
VAKADKKLYEEARASGMRKRMARTVAEAAHQAEQSVDGKAPDLLRTMAKGLRSVADTLEDRATGGPEKRKAAAQKAARTRKRNAAARSASAQKAARTRASGRSKAGS